MDAEAFISAVQHRPAIWMCTHSQHKFKNVVKVLWEEIRLLFPEYSVDVLKKKWKTLKDTYRKELRKIPIPRSGDGAVNIEIKWKYFKLLSFLRDELIVTVGDSNLEDNSNQESMHTTDVESDATIREPNSEEENSNNQLPTTYEPPSQLFNETAAPRNSPNPTTSSEFTEQPVSSQSVQPPITPIVPSTSSANPSRKRKTPNDLRTEYLEIEKSKLRLMELELSKNNNGTQPETKSEDYHFLMSILPQMEKLPPLQKLRLRNKFNQALIEEIESHTYGCGNYSYQTGSTLTFNNL